MDTQSELLYIITLDKLIDYSDITRDYEAETYFSWISENIKSYLEYAEKNPDNVDLSQMREIFEIEKRVNYGRKQYGWAEMPELKNGQDAYNNENYEEAITWFKKAADKGNATAMIGLGYYYSEKKEYNEAFNWYRKAINVNEINGWQLLLIYNEKTDLVSEKEMIKWSKLSAEKGSSWGMYLYGVYCVDNDNFNEGIEWLKKSAYKGNAEAKKMIIKIYEDGIGVSKDINKVNEWRNK